MKIRDFAKEVTKKEAKLKQVNIAQILEILRVINDLLTDDVFYKLIRGL